MNINILASATKVTKIYAAKVMDLFRHEGTKTTKYSLILVTFVFFVANSSCLRGAP